MLERDGSALAPTTPVGREAFCDFAAMSEAELVVIDETAEIKNFDRQVRWNAAYCRLAQGI